MESEKTWNEEKTSLTLRAEVGGTSPIALVCLAAGRTYRFTVNGKEAEAKALTDGAYEIALPRGSVLLEAFEEPNPSR